MKHKQFGFVKIGKTWTKKATIQENLEKFCKILDDVPINFRFKLENTGNDRDGYWRKVSLGINTAWKRRSQILPNSSFFTLREKVFDALEKEGWPVWQVYFEDRRRKISPPLTKEKIKELYYRQIKSLLDIAREHGCTRQNIMALMKRYGLKRRTLSRARIEAIKKKERALIR